MLNRLKTLISSDSSGDAKLAYRVLTEHGVTHWKGYAAGLAFMGISAACTAAAAYLIGRVVNATYFTRDFSALFVLCVTTIALFTTKGLAAYGQAVLLARVGNRITAENQGRIFDKLVQEGIGYFADRHSSHFTTSAVYGASSVTTVLSVVLLALGRDVMSLVGLAVG